jgi:hypothetical protein
MIKVVGRALSLASVLHVLALEALALWAASHAHAVALAVLLEAVALEALALDLQGCPAQKQLLPVSAVLALALRSAGFSQLEALAVVLLAARLGTRALPHRLGVGTGGSRAVRSLESAFLLHFFEGSFGLCRPIVVVE